MEAHCRIIDHVIALISVLCMLGLSACEKRSLPEEVPILDSFSLSWVDNVSGLDFYLLDSPDTIIVPSRITQIGTADGVVIGKVIDQRIPAMPRVKDGYFVVVPANGLVASGLEEGDLEHECRKLGRERPPLESPADVRDRTR